MKRLIYVAIIIVVVTGATIYSTIKIDRVTLEMISKLEQAYEYNNNQDYENAKKTVDDFLQILDRNELLFLLFVRRDLVHNVRTASASLKDYANNETVNDFNADLMKTIEYIEVIRYNILRIT